MRTRQIIAGDRVWILDRGGFLLGVVVMTDEVTAWCMVPALMRAVVCVPLTVDRVQLVEREA